ncbi:MAG TPA: type II secretion system protein [Burkholderiaceae bacterium]|nr:type II secretion system protein [Burkholderiaceae bacterium]
MDRAERRARANESGLTLVEIIIVFLIFGLVTSMALPRALNLGSEARRAKAEALHARVRAAALATRESALSGQTGSLDGAGEVQLDGTAIQTNFGYPEASAAGIVRAARIEPAADLVQMAGGGTRAGTAILLIVEGARGTCDVLYRSPAAPNTPPAITLSTKGC